MMLALTTKHMIYNEKLYSRGLQKPQGTSCPYYLGTNS